MPVQAAQAADRFVIALVEVQHFGFLVLCGSSGKQALDTVVLFVDAADALGGCVVPFHRGGDGISRHQRGKLRIGFHVVGHFVVEFQPDFAYWLLVGNVNGDQRHFNAGGAAGVLESVRDVFDLGVEFV